MSEDLEKLPLNLQIQKMTFSKLWDVMHMVSMKQTEEGIKCSSADFACDMMTGVFNFMAMFMKHHSNKKAQEEITKATKAFIIEYVNGMELNRDLKPQNN